MSAEPVDSDTVEDKDVSIIEPASASYPVDYIMNVKLETKDGSDIPLYNKTLKLRDPGEKNHLYIERQDGTLADEFDYTKEDYWLFHVHLNDASMKIAIGGETAVVVNSNPNWKHIVETDELSLQRKNAHGQTFDLTYEFGKGGTNRFIAVRCPKMDNPAISVTVTGNYGGLHWVGLFAKTSADNTNNFVALRTTNRLLPKYAARTKKYPGYQYWYSEDGAVNLKDVFITLFPKQLFGTSGNSGKLYDQFVTDSPDNKVGAKHFEHAEKKMRKLPANFPLYKFTWNSSKNTWIKIYMHPYREPSRNPHNPGDYYRREWTGWFDYVSGLTKEEDPADGWKILATLFGSLSKILAGVLTINVASCVEGAFQFADIFDEEKMKQKSDARGFITAIAEIVDTVKRKLPGKEKVEKPNTTNVYILNQNYLHIDPRDFGTRAHGIQ